MENAHEIRGAVHVLSPSGRLDTESAADFELAVQDLLAADAKHFVIDLSKISYVSSAGLRVLLMLGKGVEAKGSLRIAGLNPQVRQVFEIAGFSKLFAIHTDLDAALAKHPHASEPAPDLGRLAAKLIGAEGAAPPETGKPGDDRIAKAAAGLLGATSEPKSKAAAAKPKAEPAAPAPESVEAEKKSGLLGRIFKRK